MTKILNYLLRPPSRGLDHAADFIQFNVFLIHSWADDERLVHNPRLLQISDQILATVLSFKTSRLGWCPMLGAVVYSETSQSPPFVNGLKEPGHGYERTKPGFILRVLSVCCIVVQLNILKPNSARVGSYQRQTARFSGLEQGSSNWGSRPPGGSRKGSMGVARCFKNIIKVLTRKHFKQMRKFILHHFY